MRMRVMVIPALLGVALAVGHTTTGYAVDAGIAGVAAQSGGAGSLTPNPAPTSTGTWLGAAQAGTGSFDMAVECSASSNPDATNALNTILTTAITQCYLHGKTTGGNYFGQPGNAIVGPFNAEVATNIVVGPNVPIQDYQVCTQAYTSFKNSVVSYNTLTCS